jgi:hypothetical protein
MQGTENDDLSAALDAVKKHRLAFWDAMLWGGTTGRRSPSADRGPARLALAGVRFVNPVDR